jgi:hypothetical protein
MIDKIGVLYITQRNTTALYNYLPLAWHTDQAQHLWLIFTLLGNYQNSFQV